MKNIVSAAHHTPGFFNASAASCRLNALLESRLISPSNFGMKINDATPHAAMTTADTIKTTCTAWVASMMLDTIAVWIKLKTRPTAP